MDKKKRIKELVQMLNCASVAYYRDEEKIMPNDQWDEGFDAPQRLEEKTELILPDNPTQIAERAINIGDKLVDIDILKRNGKLFSQSDYKIAKVFKLLDEVMGD